MNHPLTDEMIQSFVDESLHMPGYEDDIRAAADWQLEQMLKFMEEHEQLFGGFGTISVLKDAMRPAIE